MRRAALFAACLSLHGCVTVIQTHDDPAAARRATYRAYGLPLLIGGLGDIATASVLYAVLKSNEQPGTSTSIVPFLLLDLVGLGAAVAGGALYSIGSEEETPLETRTSTSPTDSFWGRPHR